MAKITDPDQLNQSTEVVFDTSAKTIQLLVSGNLSTDGVTLQSLYSFCKEEWKTDSTLIKFPFPLEAITPEQFELINGWDFKDTTTKNLIRDAGWALKNTSGVSLEEYIGFVTLGSVGVNDQIYYQLTNATTDPTDIVLTGPANQAIKVYGDGTHGDFDSRSYLKCFVREYQMLYAQSQLSDIGVTTVTYQVYRFPLANSSDLKITHDDGTVGNGSGAYADVDVTWYGTAQERTIGGTAYDFSIIIEGDNLTAEQIYEKVQYLLRQTSDIDEGAGTKRGDVTNSLLRFVGDTLVTSTGVYIDNFQSTDTNRLEFYDDGSTKRTFPYVAAGTIYFNTNLVDDGAAIYRMYFTNANGNEFGTSGAIIVDDNDDVDISGTITGASIQFSFDYEGNAQGGRTPNTDADVTIVAIGLDTAQYVKTTGTILRSTANSFSLVSSLERNYSNPA